MEDHPQSKLDIAVKAAEQFASADQLFCDEEMANLGRAGFQVACNLELKRKTNILLFNPDSLEMLTATVKYWNAKRKKLTDIREFQNPSMRLPDSKFTTETAALYLVAVV